MIYELRVYRCVPGRLPALLKRFETNTLRIWERLGIKQAGFWTQMVGDANGDLYYLLQWESLAERERNGTRSSPTRNGSRSAPRASATGRSSPMSANQFLKPTAFSSVK